MSGTAAASTEPAEQALEASSVDLDRIERLESQLATIVKGKSEVIRLAVVALLARGHVLIEDVPGVGKTTLAQALTRSLGLAFQRIQFTSDLLPSDIVGVSVFNQNGQEFEFVPGPVFANVVLADEINRASPKTQSALLEAMSERRVSVDRKRYKLPDSFLVIATQNPLEFVGTFPLPESQLDRFMMSLQLGYPPRQEERDLLLGGGVGDLIERLEPALSENELRALQDRVPRVKVAEKLADYILAIVEHTRTSSEFLLGVSTRGAQSLFSATQAMALADGRDYAVPDDVQALAPAVLAHRLSLKGGGSGLSAAREAVERVLRSVPVPL